MRVRDRRLDEWRVVIAVEVHDEVVQQAKDLPWLRRHELGRAGVVVAAAYPVLPIADHLSLLGPIGVLHEFAMDATDVVQPNRASPGDVLDCVLHRGDVSQDGFRCLVRWR